MTQFGDFKAINYLPLSKKQSQQYKPIRICNCPCVAQIQQYQKMLELKRQYTKTIQLQNLRRNEERISLQSQIDQLRLQLEQPCIQKQQLKDKVEHFKRQSQTGQTRIKMMEGQVLEKQSQIVCIKNELTDLRNDYIKLRFQNNLNIEQASGLRVKINQMYQEHNITLPKDKKVSSFEPIKSQDVNDIFEKINKKWQQFGEELQKKHNIQIHKIQTKYKNQIQLLKIKIFELEKQSKQKNSQIYHLINQKCVQGQKALSSQKQIDKFKLTKLIKQNQAQIFIKRAKNIYEQKVKHLQNEINSLKLQKQQWNQKQRQLSKTKCFQVQLRCHQRCDVTRRNDMRHEQIQTQPDSQVSTCVSQIYLALQKKYDANVQQLKQKDIELFKLDQRVKSFAKIRELYNQKQEQLRQHRQFALLRQSNHSKSSTGSKSGNCSGNPESKGQLQKGKQNSTQIQNQQIIRNLLVNTLFSKYSESTQSLKEKLFATQQQLRQKDSQIISLEQANSSLKKMKISSLDDNTKIIALQRQNAQFRKAFGLINNQKPTTNKLIRSGSRNSISFKTGASYAKSHVQSRIHQQQTKKSMIQIREPNFDSRQYLTYKNSDSIRSIKSCDSQTPQFLLQVMCNKKKDKNLIANKNLNKLRRNDTFESEEMNQMLNNQRNQQRKVNFCLQVPSNTREFESKSDWEDKDNLERSFQY